MARVADEEGWPAAAAVGGRYYARELMKMPKVLAAMRSRPYGLYRDAPPLASAAIDASIGTLGVDVVEYVIDVPRFWQHVRAVRYPRWYAAGPMSEGGAREQKLLEYFVSLDLVRPMRGEVVIDIASEWSVFPRVVRRLTGAEVYRQDLIYCPGIHGDRIGGSAGHMDIPDAFADKLVTHNAYEHFEGTADTDFIKEASRVLRPGGVLCILPLNMTEHFTIMSDPLVNRRGIQWDPGARVVEVPTWHNRFGRFYDAHALTERVLEPARRVGLKPTIYRVANTQEVDPSTYLHYALVLTKQGAS